MTEENVYAESLAITGEADGGFVRDVMELLHDGGVEGVNEDTIAALIVQNFPMSGLIQRLGVSERLAHQIVEQVAPYARFNQLLAEVGIWEASRAVLPEMGIDVAVAYDGKARRALFGEQGAVIFGEHNMFIDVLVEAATAAPVGLKFFMMATTDKLLPNIRPFMIPAYFTRKALMEPIDSRILSNKIAGIAAKLMVEYGLQTYTDELGQEHQCTDREVIRAQNCISKQAAIDHLAQDRKLSMFPGGNGLKGALWKIGIIEIMKGILVNKGDMQMVPVFWNVRTRGLMKFSYQIYYGPPVRMGEIVRDPNTVDSIAAVGHLHQMHKANAQQIDWKGLPLEPVY